MKRKEAPLAGRIEVAHFTFDVDNRSNSGTARVAREVILSLSNFPALRQNLIHFQSCEDNIYSLSGARELKFTKLRLPFASGFFSFLRLICILRLRGLHFDIAHWHSSRVYPLFFLFPAKKHVVTLHDMNQMVIPGADTIASIIFRMNLWLCRNKVDLIIGVSNQASKSIVELGGFKEKKVRTLYWGSSFDQLIAEKPHGMNLDPGFLLIVSRWQPYKNVHLVVRAYLDLIERGHELPKLVLVGKPVKGFDNPYAMARVSGLLSKKIFFFQDLKDSELAHMYDKCLVNIVPSLYEGFGLSVLEAMKRQKFSLCHSGTATSEIAGESGIAINMSQSLSIQKAIVNIVNNPSLVTKLNECARNRAQTFSWDGTGSLLVEMYRDLVHA